MTRDDIIRMVREAGLRPIDEFAGAWITYDEPIERFAALVAAAEREAILKEGYRKCAEGQKTTQFCGMLQQAVLTEREACAKVCDDLWQEDKTAYDCREAIRARGQA
jgi:hypothetical protein